MSHKSCKVLVTADPDADDCLADAAQTYIADHPELKGYDLDPKFEDDSDRRYVELTVPAWHLTPGTEAEGPEGGFPGHPDDA